MKKIVLVLAVLMLAAPAFGAAVTITAAQVGTTKEVTISYGTSGQLPRAFALDITVDNDANITDVTNFFAGECNDSNGYGIFPASFAREIDADDPNWADANYTPVADVNDLPGDTQGGKGTSGVTIEMGSLYAASKGPPESSGTLCSVWVSGDCNVGFALNVGRAGIVLEDGNDANTPPNSVVLIGCHVTTAVVCTVPDVVGDSNDLAQLDIIAAGFTIGSINHATSGTIPREHVISTNPAAGAAPCGSAVGITLSSGCFPWADPNYQAWLDVNEPDCWCYLRQCHGDTDNVESEYGEPPIPIMPKPKAWVTVEDQDVLLAGYKKAYSGDPTVDTWICADFNRKENEYGEPPIPIMPKPKARVTVEDTNILLAYYKVVVPPDCQ